MNERINRDIWYSTGEVEHMVGFLRWAANKNGGLDIGGYWELCDEAADMIEFMLHYEQSHGLRKNLTHTREDIIRMARQVGREMTREDIIRMAQKAGYGRSLSVLHVYALERFAALVAAAEREACAKECELLGAGPTTLTGRRDNAIWRITSNRCAAAIRTRGEKWPTRATN